MALNNNGRDEVTGGAERDPGLDRIYRDGANDAPPARLDAAILAAARREVGARPVRVSAGLRRWRVPVSLAAVVVLSVSLVTLVKEEGGEQLLQSGPDMSPRRPSATLPAEPAPPVPAGRARPAAAAPRADAGTGAPEAADKAAEGNLAGASGSASAQGAASAVAPEPAAKPQPQPFRDSATLADRAAPSAPAIGSSQDLARAPAVAERRAAPMASPPASESAGARMQARKEAAYGEDNPSPVWQGYEKEPPQKWIERIGELRRQLRGGDADAMLAEFRRRFPGHPLPADLR